MENNLRKIRESLGFSQDEAAEKLGTSRSQYVKLERGERRLSDVWIERASKGFGVSPGSIIDSSFMKEGEVGDLEPSPSAIISIPIRGEVAAGLWREVDDVSQLIEPLGYAVTVAIPDYPANLQFALIVRGESLNKIAPDGSTLHCLDYLDGNAWDVKDGDLVIVQRSKFQGAMIETTAKRVRKNGDFELWPESDHPDFQEPLKVKDFRGEECDEEIRILAKVLSITRTP